MSGKADVLHRWLGIPPEEQPPNHYRLLGANLFEPSEEVIRHLAYQRKVALRIIEKGPEREQVKHLIAAIEAAAECLIDPKKKAAYDQFLQLQVNATAARDDAAPRSTERSTIAPVSVSVQSSDDPNRGHAVRAYRQRRRHRNPVLRGIILALQVVVGGLMGSALAVFILWHAAGSDPLGLFAKANSDDRNRSSGSNRQSPGQRNSEISHNSVAEASSDSNPGNDENGSENALDSTNENGQNLSIDPGSQVVDDQVGDLRPGLIGWLYEPHPSQTGRERYVHPSKLGDPISEPFIRESLAPFWGFDGSKNGVLVGYLRIDEPGEYVFHTYNYYDYNALFVDRKLVCPFRGSTSVGTDPTGKPNENKERIVLSKGLVPIASVGFVGCRGTVKVLWAKAGDLNFVPIPPELLFHAPTANPRDFFGDDKKDNPLQGEVSETPSAGEITPDDENTQLSEHGVRIELPSGAVVDSDTFANDAAALGALADAAEPVISVEYADGSHLGTAQHKSGKFNGLAFANYSDEYPKFVGQYIDGRRDGNFTSWGPEGKIRFWAQFRAGTLHGLACFFEDERLKLVLEYSVKNLRGVHIVENGATIQSFESDSDLPVGVLDNLRHFELYEKESKQQEKELEEKVREIWRDFQGDLIRERKINASIRLKQKRAERAKKAADYLRALSRAAGF